ncbi:UNVERIFIED_CONTAM: Dual specificity tyrosine-phosphorylation-regulated kinase, partial [Siphonaria sp. JEL0065]
SSSPKLASSLKPKPPSSAPTGSSTRDRAKSFIDVSSKGSQTLPKKSPSSASIASRKPQGPPTIASLSVSGAASKSIPKSSSKSSSAHSSKRVSLDSKPVEDRKGKLKDVTASASQVPVSTRASLDSTHRKLEVQINTTSVSSSSDPSLTSATTPHTPTAPKPPTPSSSASAPPPLQQQPQTPFKNLPPANQLKLPLTPEVTLHYFKALLTDYEQTEVLAFPEVWFAGSSGVQKIGTKERRTGADGVGLNVPGSGGGDDEESSASSAKDSFNNCGYDDQRGDLYLTHHDHLAYRYEMISLLGKGSFGQCVKCYDHKLKRHVAIKIIRNKKRFEQQGLIEVKVLERLKNEDPEDTANIVHMHDSFHFRGHLCISFEILGINLYEWVKAGGYRGIHTGVVKRFSFQILKCLQLLANQGIVHCDLKPENILLKDTLYIQPARCDFVASSESSYSRSSSFIPPDFKPNNPQYGLKVIDLGSSCFENEKVYTYVQSRFYRSPEVILGISYTVGIDMWSLGCILAELFMGYPLFPGENEQDQLARIMEVLGVPPTTILDRGTRSKLFFDMSTYTPRIVANSKGRKFKPSTKTLGGVLRTSDSVFIDFLLGCLDWSPESRFTPAEALNHEWMKDYVDGSRSVKKVLVDALGRTANSGPVLLASGRLATTSSLQGRTTTSTATASIAKNKGSLPTVDTSMVGKGPISPQTANIQFSSPFVAKKQNYRASFSGNGVSVAGKAGVLPPISGGSSSSGSGGHHTVKTRNSMYGGLVGTSTGAIGNGSGGSSSNGSAGVQKRQSLGANLSRSYTTGNKGGRVGAPSLPPQWK